MLCVCWRVLCVALLVFACLSEPSSVPARALHVLCVRLTFKGEEDPGERRGEDGDAGQEEEAEEEEGCLGEHQRWPGRPLWEAHAGAAWVGVTPPLPLPVERVEEVEFRVGNTKAKSQSFTSAVWAIMTQRRSGNSYRTSAILCSNCGSRSLAASRRIAFKTLGEGQGLKA